MFASVGYTKEANFHIHIWSGLASHMVLCGSWNILKVPKIWKDLSYEDLLRFTGNTSLGDEKLIDEGK